jgi:hypothetical protein
MAALNGRIGDQEESEPTVQVTVTCGRLYLPAGSECLPARYVSLHFGH